jgi:hypothetical protein
MDQDDLDALELLKQLLNPTPNIEFYFHYDTLTGRVMSIRNYFESDDTYPYIKVSQSDYDPDISMNDYRIIDKDGKKTLVKNLNLIDNIPKIDDTIYQIRKQLASPEVKISQRNYQFDLLIEQDNDKKEFRIRVSGEIKDQYHQVLTTNRKLVCYVTAENDPNILYRTLDIPMGHLLNYNYYTIPYGEYDGTPCNIFAFRFFQNYLHLVIE